MGKRFLDESDSRLRDLVVLHENPTLIAVKGADEDAEMTHRPIHQQTTAELSGYVGLKFPHLGLHILDQIGAHMAECHSSFRIELDRGFLYLLPILCNPIHQTLHRARQTSAERGQLVLHS
jgi:hypothetical protein